MMSRLGLCLIFVIFLICIDFTHGQTTDIDECLNGAHDCDQICTNTVGSYKCSCHIGYRWQVQQRHCVDIDECHDVFIKAKCSSYCHNINGSYSCSCQPGQVLDLDGVTCINSNIDECLNGAHDCDQICTNTVGSYKCSCHIGYRWQVQQRHCVDIDECHDVFIKAKCSSYCHNINGSYSCSCQPGQVLDLDGVTCINSNRPASSIPSSCRTVLASPACTCPTGYTLNPNDVRVCDEIDECSNITLSSECDPYTEVCYKRAGNFSCECKHGFFRNGNKSCEDIDECLNHFDNCQQQCINTIGSYQCNCSVPGYTLALNEWNCTGSSLPHETTNQNGDKDNLVMGLSVGISSFVLICIIIGGAYFWSKRQKKPVIDQNRLTALDNFRTQQNALKKTQNISQNGNMTNYGYHGSNVNKNKQPSSVVWQNDPSVFQSHHREAQYGQTPVYEFRSPYHGNNYTRDPVQPRYVSSDLISSRGQLNSRDMYHPASRGQPNSSDLYRPAYTGQLNSSDLYRPAYTGQLNSSDLYRPAYTGQLNSSDLYRPASRSTEHSAYNINRRGLAIYEEISPDYNTDPLPDY